MEPIQTERLIIRSIVQQDHDELEKIILDAKVVKYLRYQVIKTPTEFDEIFSDHFFADSEATFGIESKKDHTFIGFYEFHDEGDVGLLTYAISPNAWGNGYMAEVGQAMMAYGFLTLEFNEIQADYAGANLQSKRVMEKIGMHSLGKIGTHQLDTGDVIDVMAYSLKKEDWQNRVNKRNV
ncbi:GNAT family N-acetyltransferase [Dellaglioa sp. BT-FLS60]